jgi:hypothetical protein
MTESDRFITLTWRKSTFSAEHECVEVAAAGGSVFTRDSKNRSCSPVGISFSAWRILLERIKAGELDPGDC